MSNELDPETLKKMTDDAVAEFTLTAPGSIQRQIEKQRNVSQQEFIEGIADKSIAYRFGLDVNRNLSKSQNFTFTVLFLLYWLNHVILAIWFGVVTHNWLYVLLIPAGLFGHRVVVSRNSTVSYPFSVVRSIAALLTFLYWPYAGFVNHNWFEWAIPSVLVGMIISYQLSQFLYKMADGYQQESLLVLIKKSETAYNTMRDNGDLIIYQQPN